MADKLEHTPFTAESIQKKGDGFLGVEKALLIKAFFGGNALVAIIVLALITFFLFREGIEFFPQYRAEMQLFRESGQEFVGLVKEEVDQFNELQGELQDVQTKVITKLYDEGKEWEEVTALTKPFQDFVREAGASIQPLSKVVKEATTIAVGAKEKVIEYNIRKGIEGMDPSEFGFDSDEQADAFLVEKRTELTAMLPAIQEANEAFRVGLTATLENVPTVELPEAQLALDAYVKKAKKFLNKVTDFEKKLESYDPNKPFTMGQTIGGFLLGADWITASSWQDFYGIWPLLSGSLLVSVVALSYAIPFGIFAAIYINQVASPKEQNFIKPYIEFISAIPSVVIGFFGIAILGTFIRNASNWAFLSWLPFFPISERLNAYTAGTLLALMAVPTIFTLAEDALNNVPKAFKEASVAMGATRWQTIWRIQVPTALSGIISAVLLGFGRVIGETMVVLLCAGNRIAVPDLSKGPGTFFEPVHTMTGIIAQEMGEVVPGSIHYRALFCVGIFLFFLSLIINYFAQLVVRKYKISAG